MTVRFHCTHCGKRLKAAADFVGLEVKCSRCDTALIVPAGNEADAQAETERIEAARHQAVSRSHAHEKPLIEFRKHEEDEELVDMTAMVDVTFFLLIFFMVTSMHSMQASLEMPPPDATANAAQGQTVQQLDEDSDAVIVRVDRDSVTWVEGAEAPSRQDLIAKLREAREGPGAVSKMVVMANGDAFHEKVVEALDAGMDVGMESVSLATVEED